MESDFFLFIFYFKNFLLNLVTLTHYYELENKIMIKHKIIKGVVSFYPFLINYFCINTTRNLDKLENNNL